MKSFEIDFHGYTVEDALRIAESLVNQARINQEEVYCSFITGRGKIQESLLKTLRDKYKLDPLIPMYNQGLVLVELC